MDTAQALTVSLAALGYPGFQYLRPAVGTDPVDVLLTALAQDELEPRIIEALPWVLIHSDDIDWERLLSSSGTRPASKPAGVSRQHRGHKGGVER
jgi:hypothetical protein